MSKTTISPARPPIVSACADDCAAARTLVARKRALARAWSALRIGEPEIETNDGDHAFKVRVFLASLDPDLISVELYANGVAVQLPAIQPMSRLGSPVVDGTCVYTASVSAARPPSDYTVRVVPKRDPAMTPLEMPLILWQH